MQIAKHCTCVVLILLACVSLTACGPSEEEIALQLETAAAETAASWTSTPAPTATMTAIPTEAPTATVPPTPMPEPGGVVRGIIYLSDVERPASIDMVLISESGEDEYTSSSDSEGYYAFTGVTPGEYRLEGRVDTLVEDCPMVRLDEQDMWKFSIVVQGDGTLKPFATSEPFQVADGEETVLDLLLLCEL